jgi:hypothetical protein
MDERARRTGENEARFREVNERIEHLSKTIGGGGEFRIVCECGDRRCAEQINVTVEEYEAVRADSERFLIKPGHEIPEVEEVVERHVAYWVVSKDRGAAARLARRTDPRR